MKTAVTLVICLLSAVAVGQTPTPFTCSGTDGFGYYISSATTALSGDTRTFSSSRLSKLVTATGVRTDVCTAAQVGVALNALAFNPNDNFLYAVSRYDATQFSGKLYRLGENCGRVEIPVSGAIAKFSTNNRTTIDNAGGNIGSGTFDLSGNYYVNTSFTLSGSTGFRNKIQKIRITGNTATVVSDQTLNCSTCTDKVQVNDIIFDETSGTLYGSNRQTNKLYAINASTGAMTEVGATGVSSTILGVYKNRFGAVRAIDELGNIYAVNLSTGAFSSIGEQATLNSGNADAASGCYAPPSISGTLFVDANGLTDNTVNGTPTNKAGTTTLYANLVQAGVVDKRSVIAPDGTFEFLGDFSGDYEVQISVTQGTIGQAPPPQALPGTHRFVGDKLGTGSGSDGTPNGRLTLSGIVAGNSVTDVTFGIDTRPTASNVSAAEQSNPGGSARATVPPLSVADAEDGTPTTIRVTSIPDASTKGTLYYNGTAVTTVRDLVNFQSSLFEFDPIDGSVTVSFTYRAKDRANVTSNNATVTMEFSSTLPVTLVYFTGAASGTAVELRWQTSSEYNSDYFVVERSQSGGTYEDIGRIQAEGFTNELQNYTFTDPSPYPRAYYRLRDVDFDGTYSHSSSMLIDQERAAAVEVYPSLVGPSLWVAYDERSTLQLNVSIYGTDGRRVLSADLAAGQHRIDAVTQLPRGFYNVVITDATSGRISSTKIVKQ
ncbi:hypothetical protein LEM8419_02743 [Neolewinella maritima]|uniref:DUF6923 domain-containing protein n=1 Tax=Neolewinella maritima TaxID=1383882 RepID=A0ABN8F4H8_9BACT|nr:hypothetical protein [Neolewinella maritima]CAH1001835.1 hypothetical protein LEM8419_02743 [Neolewinella maritima]